MRKQLKVAGFIGSLGVTAALVGASVVGTGAYFSDTKAGNHITGTMGSIRVQGYDGSGANNLDMVFTNMLPGETHSQTVRYANTGEDTEDVWVVFNNTANATSELHALNQLGTYGEVHVSSNGSEKFASANLNDNANTCPPGAGNPACAPLPGAIKVADGLQPNQQGDFTFSFTPSTKFKNVQDTQVLGLDYDLVATQHGVTPGQ